MNRHASDAGCCQAGSVAGSFDKDSSRGCVQTRVQMSCLDTSRAPDTGVSRLGSGREKGLSLCQVSLQPNATRGFPRSLTLEAQGLFLVLGFQDFVLGLLRTTHHCGFKGRLSHTTRLRGPLLAENFARADGRPRCAALHTTSILGSSDVLRVDGSSFPQVVHPLTVQVMSGGRTFELTGSHFFNTLRFHRSV